MDEKQYVAAVADESYHPSYSYPFGEYTRDQIRTMVEFYKHIGLCIWIEEYKPEKHDKAQEPMK